MQKLQYSVHNNEGKVSSKIELDTHVFGIVPNEAVVHQALVRQRANARQGNASTKTRGQVRGSTRKLFRQKGTGRARQGSIRAPHRRGGGIVFGPHPRSYAQRMPKKMRRLALRSILSAKAQRDELIIINELSLDKPKLKEMKRTLEAMGVKSSALIIIPEPNANIYKSTRNLERVKVIPAPLLNVVDLMSHKFLVMSTAAVAKIEGIWGTKRAE